jgi:ABC-type cobalamin/Fe3+-siderophores transport system ATPase subunit
MEDLDPKKMIKDLPIAQRQMIEIAKACFQNAKIIAFDEPTMFSLGKETSIIFSGIIRGLRNQGKSISMYLTGWKRYSKYVMRYRYSGTGDCIDTFDNISQVTPVCS